MCNIKVKICPYDISDYAVSHNFCSFALPFLFFNKTSYQDEVKERPARDFCQVVNTGSALNR